MARQEKLTISELQTFVKGYVATEQQAGAWKETRDNVYKMLDKIGEIVEIKGNFNNPLAPYILGNNLKYGRTIEEFMTGLPQVMNAVSVDAADGKEALKSYLPALEEVSYSFGLGKKVIPVTVPFGDVEKAAIDAESASNMVASLTEQQMNTQTLYEFGLCKQLIGNMAEKAIAATGLDKVVGTLNTTDDQEQFIVDVKADVEATKFAGDNRSLSKSVIGATPDESLVLFVRAGIMPSISVKTRAGAFHSEDLGFGCEVVVVDDFGKGNDNVSAVLCDVRGIKLKPTYKATRENENGYADFINIFKISDWSGFLSKYTYVKVYKKA